MADALSLAGDSFAVFMAVLTFCGTLLAIGMRRAMFSPRGRSWRGCCHRHRKLAARAGRDAFMVYAFSGDLSSLFDGMILYLTGCSGRLP